jgi:hypothetical protein
MKTVESSVIKILNHQHQNNNHLTLFDIVLYDAFNTSVLVCPYCEEKAFVFFKGPGEAEEEPIPETDLDSRLVGLDARTVPSGSFMCVCVCVRSEIESDEG